MKQLVYSISLALSLTCLPTSRAGSLQDDFQTPPAQWKTRPLWFWNAPPSREATEAIMLGSKASGYHGFGILPTPEMKLEFMSQAYLDRYEEAVDCASILGMKMCLYDEFWFPSGSAEKQLATKFPEALSKRLDMTAFDVVGPETIITNLPSGKLMAAVAMHAGSFHRINISAFINGSQLSWKVPEGAWKILFFTCVTDGAKGLVDYLDPEAVNKFVSLTYDKYYERLWRHFGKTIDSAFYDEPTFHWVQGGRAWTPSFNEKYRKKYGKDPAILYPALWFDIGPETPAARNALFGFRAELFATGFIKTLADWCSRHGIQLTGHVDQEEIVNPTGLCGDLIKSMKYQPIAGVDEIFQYGRGSRMYKVVSSAAANYDRRLVMTECYGAINKMPVATLYKEAMDQFAKGINMMVPHAVWYRTNKITFPPELSFRHPLYGPALPAYNEYMGRLQRVLQQGYPVVDVAVLYPIAGLQAGYRFGVGKPYEGGIIPPEADYMDIGERLSLDLRRDFTFLHPEVLDDKCGVIGPVLRLAHPGWGQDYRVMILPGSKVIHWSNLEKIRRFYDKGGTVVATTTLPEQSVEPGKDAKVKEAIFAMFGNASDTVRTNRNGGMACFLPKPTAEALHAILKDAVPVWDVSFETDIKVAGGNFSYLHKVVEGKDVYFFANSSDSTVESTVCIRGKGDFEQWDPHTGQVRVLKCEQGAKQSQPFTRFQLKLSPVQSCFIVGSNRSKVDQ